MTDTHRISILEDSLELQSMLKTALVEAGYEARCYGRASDFERELDDWKPDVSIVDLGLPDRDGLGILQNLSTRHDTAILVISGRSNLADKIAGLELGADDYLPKPFEITELVARVRALLRRKKYVPDDAKEETLHKLAGMTIDLSRFVLTATDGSEDQLSASEVALLRIFLNHPNRLVTREKLRDELGDRSEDQSFDRAIDVRVSRLRSKLKDPPKNPRIIKTVYGAGYILISDAD